MLIRRFAWVSLLLIVAVLAAGCGSTPTPTPEPPTATPVPSPQPQVTATTPPLLAKVEMALQHAQRMEGATLATVNGQPITWEEYEPALRQALFMVNQQYDIKWDDPAMQSKLGQLQNDVLKQVVDRALMLKVATNQGVALEDAQMKAQVDKEKASIMDSGRYADWETFLRQNGLTEESFTQVIYDTLLYNKLLSAQQVDTQGEQVHLAHIVVADQATAQQVVDKLKAGEDFAALAAQYSMDDQTKNNGGDLGWFTQELLAPEVGQVAFSLEPGQFSDPITTQHGFATIKILERAIRELDERALRQRQQEAVLAQIEAERSKAVIEYLVDFASETTP